MSFFIVKFFTRAHTQSGYLNVPCFFTVLFFYHGEHREIAQRERRGNEHGEHRENSNDHPLDSSLIESKHIEIDQ